MNGTKKFFVGYDKSQTHIVMTGIAGWDKTIRMPSAMWPVEGLDSTVFTPDNTEPCTDKAIAAIFDKLPFRLGRCYDNAKMLADALAEAGIPAKTYAGWLLFSNTVPTHHAVLVVNGNQLLDPSTRDYTSLPQLSPDATETETRAAFVDWVAAMEKKPHSETAAFGKVHPGHIYCVAELAPEKAMALRAKLERAYPKHPALFRRGKKDVTPIQEALQKRGIR